MSTRFAMAPAAVFAFLLLALAACGGDGGTPQATCNPFDAVAADSIPAVEGEPVTTGSGLAFCDIEHGSGDSPEPTETVVVQYTGWLLDGTKFDSSVDRGTPFSFAIGTGSVIKGWDEGVATMQVGGKRRLIIPPELAYGEAGASTVIPPNATLVFDVELLEIQ